MKTELKMETCMQTGCGKIATDLQVTVLQNEAAGDSDLQLNDEVEELSNSLRDLIQDETVRPKLQCLMMDPSFSMVTVQSEDSGILWETASSQCSTPWTAESSTRAGNIFFGEGEFYKTPTSRNAGKIIFIMDEAHTVRKKRDKAQKSENAKGENAVASQDLHELTDRPAMVEISMPNMKDEQNKQEEMTDPREEKEQRLFRLVSEGSEILNIVVPPKVATLDEEESKELVDNLAYMEESLTFQEQPADIEEHESCPDVVISEPGPEQTCTESMKKELQEDILPVLPGKAPQTGTVNDTDYFDMFTLLKEHAPGGSDKNEEKDDELHKKETAGLKTTEVEPLMKTKVTPKNPEDPISCGEIASELLDEVFYGGTEDHSHTESVEGCQNKHEVSKSPRKESGSALFDNEDIVLTPIFIPEGPPKIIDPCLLEEPKAMAFLYTDLYEDAVGTRKREDDAASITSEKSFHSKDSESDCYLEKFVLKDDTPLVEMVQASSATNTHGIKVWSEEKFELAKLSQFHEEPEKDTEEEITDFFRNSNSSSPCNDIEQPNPTLEETIDVKRRKVLFEDEVKQKNKGSTLNQERENSLEKTPEENEMTKLEEPLTDTISPADDICEISEKRHITSKDALVAHKSNTGPKLQLAFAEQQAVSKPLRSSLELTTLDPAETEEELKEGEVKETGKEGERREAESEHSAAS